MQPHTIILLEGTLSLALPLTFALCELFSLKGEPPPPRPGDTPEIPLVLPPSLTAMPTPRARERVLEDA